MIIHIHDVYVYTLRCHQTWFAEQSPLHEFPFAEHIQPPSSSGIPWISHCYKGFGGFLSHGQSPVTPRLLQVSKSGHP